MRYWMIAIIGLITIVGCKGTRYVRDEIGTTYTGPYIMERYVPGHAESGLYIRPRTEYVYINTTDERTVGSFAAVPVVIDVYELSMLSNSQDAALSMIFTMLKYTPAHNLMICYPSIVSNRIVKITNDFRNNFNFILNVRPGNTTIEVFNYYE